jgi:hypothetical protein
MSWLATEDATLATVARTRDVSSDDDDVEDGALALVRFDKA